MPARRKFVCVADGVRADTRASCVHVVGTGCGERCRVRRRHHWHWLSDLHDPARPGGSPPEPGSGWCVDGDQTEVRRTERCPAPPHSSGFGSRGPPMRESRTKFLGAETAGARSAIPAPASWFDLAAPWLMGGYLWVMALGGFSYIDDLGLAGGTSEAVETQLRYTAALLVINTILAGALAYRHTPVRPFKVRVWVYGLGGLASYAVAIGLAAKYSPMIF